jgi:hypothetical protein
MTSHNGTQHNDT